MTSTEIADVIKENLQNPKSASVDGVSVTQHSLAEQLAVKRHLGEEIAASNPARAFTRVKIVPPGTV